MLKQTILAAAALSTLGLNTFAATTNTTSHAYQSENAAQTYDPNMDMAAREQAASQNTSGRFYIGLGLGFSSADFSTKINGQAVGNSGKKIGFSQEVNVGYQFNPWLSTELEYIHYGNNTTTVSFYPYWPQSFGIRFDQHAVNLLAVLHTPSKLMNGFQVFLKLGGGYNHGVWSSFSKVWGINIDQQNLAQYNKASLAYGVGIGYDVHLRNGQTLTIKTEWRGSHTSASGSTENNNNQTITFTAPKNSNVVLFGVNYKL